MPPNAQVGIVIVNYNGFPFIRECLGSLTKIDYAEVQIVIVDNASSDGSPEWIAQDCPEAQIIKLSENLGFSGANNVGIRWCVTNKCEYVLLLNNDTVVEPDFLSRIMDHAGQRYMIVPKIYCYYNRELVNSSIGDFDFWRGITIPWFYGEKDSKRSQQEQQVNMASACAILISRYAFTQVGLLDEKFFLYWEDTDFIVRAIHQGFVIKFVPQAVVYHKESSSSGGRASLLATYYNNRNRLYFMYKHQKNIVMLIFFLIYYFLGRCAYIISYVLGWQGPKIKALSLGIIDFYRGKMGIVAAERYKDLR